MGIEAIPDNTIVRKMRLKDFLSVGDYLTMSDVKDEDDMASNSNAHVPTQQSVKAYVDDNIGGGGGGVLTATTYDETATTGLLFGALYDESA